MTPVIPGSSLAQQEAAADSPGTGGTSLRVGSRLAAALGCPTLLRGLRRYAPSPRTGRGRHCGRAEPDQRLGSSRHCNRRWRLKWTAAAALQHAAAGRPAQLHGGAGGRRGAAVATLPASLLLRDRRRGKRERGFSHGIARGAQSSGTSSSPRWPRSPATSRKRSSSRRRCWRRGDTFIRRPRLM